MSGSPSLKSEISEFISYLERKLIDESLATFQREQIAAAIGNLESAFDVKETPKTLLASPIQSRRSSTQYHNPVCFAVFEEARDRRNSNSENEEAHAAALLRRALHEDTEKFNKKRKSLLEIPRNEDDSSSVFKNTRDDYQILHSSSIMTNLFGTETNNKNLASFLEGGSRRASEAGNVMESTIHKFCEQFAKKL